MSPYIYTNHTYRFRWLMLNLILQIFREDKVHMRAALSTTVYLEPFVPHIEGQKYHRSDLTEGKN